MRVAIANFSAPHAGAMDFRAYWAQHELPARPPRRALFEPAHDWGFHIFALGVHLMDRGAAEHVEFWDYAATRRVSYHENGVLRLRFLNEADLGAYLDRYGPPDLFINHGRHGHAVLERLARRCFRVHVPALRGGRDQVANVGAECYLVDSEELLDARSMLYVPVVNTRRIHPTEVAKIRDFIYLASAYAGKRHDLLLDAVRNSPLTGHLHPVDASRLDLTRTRITTSNWDERDVVELLRTSRIAVYPGDWTSNPAAMWECVAAGLPIVVNREIKGGQHVVVPGVTGEWASSRDFREVMEHVLAHRHRYRPREHFEAHWDTVTLLDRYLAFFVRMGWDGSGHGASAAVERGRRRLPLNIGFVNILYSKRAERGGLGEHIADLSRELVRRGHAVTILTSGRYGTSVEDGVTVVRLGPVDRFATPGQLLTPGFLLRRLRYMWRVARYILRHRFDVIESADGGFEHLFLLGRENCPIVIKLHGDFRRIHRPAQPLAAVMAALEGLALRRSHGIYASSSAYARTVAADYGIPEQRIRTIQCGIALDGHLPPSRLRLADRYPILAGKRLVLSSVGASPNRKGAPLFIEAARQVSDPDTLFVLLCSSAPFLNSVVVPTNLVVLDPLDRADFHALMAASVVVVFPSDFESFSIATYEAMLLGRPLIVSRHIPLEGLALEYPRRVTVEHLEAGALSRAVRRVLGGEPPLPEADPALLARLRDTYGIGRVAEDTVAFYRAVVQRDQVERQGREAIWRKSST